MSIGYIKLYRKLTDSIVWANSDMLKLWVMCLTKAGHVDRNFIFNGNEINLKTGQFVTGRDALMNEFNKGAKPSNKANSRTLWRYMKQMEKEEMLSIDSNTRYSVVSIVNWASYQQSDQQVSINCPSTVHQVSTNKNDKNVKNEKNKDIVVPTEDEADSETTDNQKKKESVPYKKIIEYLNNTVGSNLLFKAKGNQAPIKARWNEGYRLKDFESVIDFKFTDPYFKDNPQFFLPKTLFGNKFGNYLQYAEFEKNKKGNKKQKEENRVTPEQLFELERLENEKEAERRYGSKQNQ